jgi:hypothetical protein
LKVSGKPIFSLDDKLLAVMGKKTITVWEVATGKRVHTFRIQVSYRRKSREGKPPRPKALRKRVGLETIRAATFLPSGQVMALRFNGWPRHKVELWSVLANKKMHRFQVTDDNFEAVTFSPDGTLLASATNETDVLTWDLMPYLVKEKPKAENLNAETLAKLWSRLAGEDAALAFQAVQRLAASPDALPFLKEHLPPAKQERYPRLMADLDADSFAVREAAAKELADLGLKAEPALIAALANDPSAEVRRRVMSLLDALEDRLLSNKMLRETRAIQVLEYQGSIKALEILEALSHQGDPQARLTKDAKAALARVAKRNDKP